jgi:hypothetical protein
MTRAALAGVAVVVAVMGTAAAPAAAEPVRRIAIVNPTPELMHAAAAALAPWRIEVVDAGAPSIDTPRAIAIAHDRGADRIAWLDAGELVVLDPETGISERRPAPDGAEDPAAAAAVALSIKTVLRLPPPPTTPDPVADPGGAREPRPIELAPTAPVITLAPSVAGGIRVPVDGTLGAHPRIEVGLEAVFGAWPALRPAIVVGYAPSVGDVGRAGLKGAWSDLELGARLAIALPLGARWSLVPGVSIAAHLVHVTGSLPPQEALDARDVGGSAGAELTLWWGAGRWAFGVGGGAAMWFGFSDYARNNVMVFESPRVTAQAQAAVRVAL